jgi:hypothetical protein
MDISHPDGLSLDDLCWICTSDFPTTMSLKTLLTPLMMVEYCTFPKVESAFQGRHWLLM